LHKFAEIINKEILTYAMLYNYWCLKIYIQIVRILTIWIPNISVKKAIRQKAALWAQPSTQQVQKHYTKVLYMLHDKIKRGQKIHVAFLLISDAVFPCRSLYELMADDDAFEPVIVITPDVMRSPEHAKEQMQQSYASLSQHYAHVIMARDDQGNLIDISKSCDLVVFASPYDHMAHRYYQMQYLRYKDVLTIYANYSYMVKAYSLRLLDYISPFYQHLWLYLVDNAENYAAAKASGCIDGQLFTAGYLKLDDYPNIEVNKKTSKTILICSHHTVQEWKDGLEISNFLRYAKLFLRLPEEYPQIHFIFRPHPLLIYNLEQDSIWGNQKTQAYLEQLLRHTNVTYSKGGDYLANFAASDGIIHDCGSFVLEYLFTEKPACFMLKDASTYDSEFTLTGQACLDHHYHVHTEDDIHYFIDNVIFNANDTLQTAR
jgi:hypothetical protein